MSGQTNTADFLGQFFARTRHSIELRALPSTARFFIRKLSNVEQFTKQHSRENLYFGVATREGSGGDKSHCRELIVLWVDIDFKTTPEPQARELVASFRILPSIVIESGGGLHVYWLLHAPIDARDERVEPILRGLAEALRADPSAAEIARIMRLPGTFNYKYFPPRECRVIEVNWERRYNLADFERFREREVAASAKANLGDVITRGQRNSTLASIAGKLRHAGFGEHELRESLTVINRRRCDPPLPDSEVATIAKSISRYQPGQPNPLEKRGGGVSTNPWSLAQGMDAFLTGDDEPLKFMFPKVIVRGAVVEVFAPRGLGKSLWALYVAVLLATAGYKVLFIDRDNPRRVVKERLLAFGATPDLKTLRFLPRENAPPLTNATAWAEFPYLDFDLIVLDSLDSAAEGIGEQDSAKPSKAIAPLLDIARRENGPAVLVLGNCVRNAKHSRGSGVIEDRADIVFEVRDATDFHPTGKKPWIEELPAGGADHWASRASRRKRREKYRLAFIATKFRVGEEPDPFVMEIDLASDPWSVVDITDVVDGEGKEQRERRAREKAEAVEQASEALAAEVRRRHTNGEVQMLKDKDAIPFLVTLGLKRSAAREILNLPQVHWELRELEGGKGHPVALFLPARYGEQESGGNTCPTKAAFRPGFDDAHFRRPHPEHTAETRTMQRVANTGAAEPPISAVSLCSPALNQKSECGKGAGNTDADDEVAV